MLNSFKNLRIFCFSIFVLGSFVANFSFANGSGDSKPKPKKRIALQTVDSIREKLSVFASKLESTESLREFLNLPLGSQLEDYQQAQAQLIRALNSEVASVPEAVNDLLIQVLFTKIIFQVGLRMEKLENSPEVLDSEWAEFRRIRKSLGKVFLETYFQARSDWSLAGSRASHSAAAEMAEAGVSGFIQSSNEALKFAKFWVDMRQEFINTDPLARELEEYGDEGQSLEWPISKKDFLNALKEAYRTTRISDLHNEFIDIHGFIEVRNRVRQEKIEKLFNENFKGVEVGSPRIEFFKKVLGAVDTSSVVFVWNYLVKNQDLLLSEKVALAQMIPEIMMNFRSKGNQLGSSRFANIFSKIASEASPVRPFDFFLKEFSKYTDPDPSVWFDLYKAMKYGSLDSSYNEYERVLRRQFLAGLLKYFNQPGYGTKSAYSTDRQVEAIAEINLLNEKDNFVFHGTCAYWARWMFGL